MGESSLAGSPDAFVSEVDARLRALADAGRAVQMRAYLLDQFAFLGLPAPVRREAVKDLIRRPLAHADELMAVASALWARPEREFRYTAIDLLRQQRRLLSPAELPALQTLLLREPWWETVDGLSAVISEVLHAARPLQPTAPAAMDDWIVHEAFWVRRAAMLHQLGWRLDTDTARLSRYALQLASEREFFIRKATGWALRDYARWNPGFVWAFVDAHRAELSALTVREACRVRTNPAGDTSSSR